MDQTKVLSRAEALAAARAITDRTAHRPRVAIILGSGLNPLAEAITGADAVPFAEIPFLVPPTVAGHVGRLVIGTLEGQEVLVVQGRLHAYEGLSQQQVAFPVRVMGELGIRTLIVTNAAGGINASFRTGDLMLIVDHVGFAAMAGANPLVGPNQDELGPRFVDMSAAYDADLRRLAARVAANLNIDLKQGVYGGLFGPAFETPAEVRFLRLIGVDAVGMSTVAEVMVARHMGMRVLGISGISNCAIDAIDSERVVNHDEVLAAGKVMVPRLIELIRGIVAELPA